MKDDINLFGCEFENIILDCQKEESEVKDLYQRYIDALRTLEENNEERRKLLKKIRLNKLEEIKKEIEETKNKIAETIARINNVSDKSYGNKLCKTGKTLEETLEEKLENLISYLTYLIQLKIRLCKIFGHDIGSDKKCRCCGLDMQKCDYEAVKRDTIYKGVTSPADIIVPAEVETTEFIINDNRGLVLNLPRYSKRKRVVARVKSK